MMPQPELLLFVLTMSLTPGPNNVMIMASGVNHGVIKSIPHLLGINIGFILMLIAVGLGLGKLFDTLPQFHLVIKILGSLYLLYLAWLIASTPTGPEMNAQAQPLTFLQAALFQWVNPKAWVLITSIIATYADPELGITAQVLMIASIFAVLGPPCTATWLIGGVSLQRILKQPKSRRAFNVTMGLLIAISIRPVIIDLLTMN